jgi:hypothetical protein
LAGLFVWIVEPSSIAPLEALSVLRLQKITGMPRPLGTATWHCWRTVAGSPGPSKTAPE